MRKRKKVLGSIVCWMLLTLMAAISLAAGSEIEHKVSIGTRRHINHSEFDSLPFGDGDLTYLVAYECHEAVGFWQLGIGYTPEPSGDKSVDYVLTPQISLIVKDGFWRVGLGALKSYIAGNQGNNWMDIYWQFNFGINIPFSSRIGLDVNSYYVFEEWDKIMDFDTRDIEFGVLLNFKF
jgi:hypothetical protein